MPDVSRKSMLQKQHSKLTPFPRKDGIAWVCLRCVFLLSKSNSNICETKGNFKELCFIFWRHLKANLVHKWKPRCQPTNNGILSCSWDVIQFLSMLGRGLMVQNDETQVCPKRVRPGLWITMEITPMSFQKTSRSGQPCLFTIN